MAWTLQTCALTQTGRNKSRSVTWWAILLWRYIWSIWNLDRVNHEASCWNQARLIHWSLFLLRKDCSLLSNDWRSARFEVVFFDPCLASWRENCLQQGEDGNLLGNSATWNWQGSIACTAAKPCFPGTRKSKPKRTGRALRCSGCCFKSWLAPHQGQNHSAPLRESEEWKRAAVAWRFDQEKASLNWPHQRKTVQSTHQYDHAG